MILKVLVKNIVSTFWHDEINKSLNLSSNTSVDSLKFSGISRDKTMIDRLMYQNIPNDD